MKRKSKMTKDVIQDFLYFIWLNEVWIPARVEMGMDREWYLVGLPVRVE